MPPNGGFSSWGLEMNEFFRTKTAARAFMRGILASHPINTPIDGEDLDKVLSVLKRHPRFHQKAGLYPYDLIVIEIEYMRKKKRCFAFHQMEGDIVDISYNVALSSNPEKLVADNSATEAARLEIADDIFRFRNSRPQGLMCYICDGEIQDDLHIDHYDPPFRDIFSEFLRFEGVTDIETVDAVPTGRLFKDRDQAKRWVDYHRCRAHLVYTHASCNIRKG